VAAIGIDVGGTFTDFVLLADGVIRAWKRLSTPADPSKAVLAGLPDVPPERVVHGSTVATNALLERRGPRTVLLTTEGFRDLLTIRRQTRPSLYDLEPRRTPHVVRPEDTIGVRERLDAHGRVLVPLGDEELQRVVEAARATGGEAFAVCLLHSYVDDRHERLVAAALRAAGLECVLSADIAPEPREYERASTTAIAAFLRPTIARYLEPLQAALRGLRLIHSAGGLVAPEEALARPTSMILSGPAGGVLGALAVARAAGFDRILSFDMGGTSTDVALCLGEPSVRNESEVDGLAIRTPALDVVTVGAGGGSIARIDAGGALLVGPESAGADPGPACYGRGLLPTVTDANLVLGRLRPEQALGGSVQPKAERAAAALARLGSPVEAAAAVVAVANAAMARALRRVSLERGHDPATFTLVAFGGAGPLHACELAADVGIPRVLVPRYPGVLSALGMLAAPEAVEVQRGMVCAVDEAAAPAIANLAAALEREARQRLARFAGEPAALRWYADARYVGQAHELRVAVAAPAPAAIAEAFHAAHLERFGFHAPDRPVELVALRVRAEVPVPEIIFPRSHVASPLAEGTPAMVWTDGGFEAATVLHREALGVGATVEGPMVIVQDDCTTYVPPGWRGRTDVFGNLLLEASR
jgi:N-methylhydantoinase A